MNYTYFYKNKFEDTSSENIYKELEYDFFISAYNESDRVKHIFKNINAKNKHWLIFPEYSYDNIELSSITDTKFDYSQSFDLEEDDIILDYLDKNNTIWDNKKIAIDITGMLRPYIVFFVRFLAQKKDIKVDFIYSEPEYYVKKEDTQFSIEYSKVREIKGCLGSHETETNNDILILGSGYDYQGIIRVAKEKKQAKKVQVLGFPPLNADMFQQNILMSYKTAEDASSGEFDLQSDNIILAPANDPFVTAELIKKFIKNEERKNNITNLYLSPLGTKAQTLGMALYYSMECLNSATSIIFPFSRKYSRETSKGISKFWVYQVVFN